MKENNSKKNSTEKKSFGELESESVKLFDKKIFRKIYSFTKAYNLRLFFILVFVIITVCCELLIPVITKNVIDDYINPGYCVLDLSAYPQKSDEFSSRYKSELLEIAENLYIINKNSVNIFVNDDLKFLNEKNLYNKEKTYYLLAKSKVNNPDKLKENLKNTSMIEYENYYLIRNKDISKLGIKEINLLRANDLENVKRYGLYLVAVIILNFIFTYWQVYSITVLGQKVMYDLRISLFEHLQKMPLQFFDKNPTGVLVTRVTSDIANLEEFFSAILVNLFKDVIILVGIISVMLLIDIKLALISFSLIPVIILITYFFKKKMRNAYRKVRSAISKINAYLAENIRGMLIIQLFHQEKKSAKRFSVLNKNSYQASLKEILLNSFFSPIMSFLKYLGTGLILYIGAGFILTSTISLGILVAFLAYIEKLFQPIQDITEKINLMQSALASSERIFSILEKDNEKEPPLDDLVKTENIMFKGAIEFRNVWFAYNEENWVLKNFNLKIRKGEKFALVGATGAGKTSVINILSRLYPIQKGAILIDGINIEKIELSKLRKIIGVVQQDVFLFSGSIKDNIVLGNKKIGNKELDELTKYTNSYNFINKFSNKYNHELKEEGSSISTGQKQLISFSRMLAYNPKILVLDEATSSVDTETEILIQDALDKLTKDRTSIIIAHRLSTIQHCDKIIVLHKGEIKEAGNHQELLSQKGLYYKLYQLQYKDQLFEKA